MSVLREPEPRKMQTANAARLTHPNSPILISGLYFVSFHRGTSWLSLVFGAFTPWAAITPTLHNYSVATSFVLAVISVLLGISVMRCDSRFMLAASDLSPMPHYIGIGISILSVAVMVVRLAIQS